MTRSRLLLGVPLLAVFLSTPPALADCPDIPIVCPTGETIKIGTCWDLWSLQCYTCRSIVDEVRNQCPQLTLYGCASENCRDEWFGRNDGCSAPGVLQKPVHEMFRAACAIHDLCYAVPGRSKEACDLNFMANMQSTCSMPGAPAIVGQGTCRGSASAAYAAVALSSAGDDGYNSGQDWARARLEPPPSAPVADLTLSCQDFRDRDYKEVSITMPETGTLTIDLCSNPSTGYRWEERLMIEDIRVLKQAAHEFVGPSTVMPGAPGHQRWTLTGLRAGTSRVRFEYARSWEDESEWMLDLAVEVPSTIAGLEPAIEPTTHHAGSSDCGDYKRSNPVSANYDLMVGDTVGYGMCAAEWMGCDWVDEAEITNGDVVRQTGHTIRKKTALRRAPRERFGFEAVGPGDAEVRLVCRSDDGVQKNFVLKMAVRGTGAAPPPLPTPSPVDGAPEVVWLPRDPNHIPPDGLKLSCTGGPDGPGSSRLCPVIRWNGYTYWAYSHIDNRVGTTLVAYDDTGNEIQRWTRSGARYVWSIGVDMVAGTATLSGQADRTIVLPLDEIFIPAPVGRVIENR